MALPYRPRRSSTGKPPSSSRMTGRPMASSAIGRSASSASTFISTSTRCAATRIMPSASAPPPNRSAVPMSKIAEADLEERIAEARVRARALADTMTDEEDAVLTKAAMDDPDSPPLPADVRLVTYQEARRRGRPRVPAPKQQITLRLDPDVIEKFRATGPGWQGRINDALRKAAG